MLTILTAVVLLLLTPFAFAESEKEKSPIKVLIVDGYSNHDWKKTTAIIQKQLLASGLFSVDVSTTPATQQAPGWAAWRPEFSKYDVVVQNCNSHGGRPQWPEAMQKDLEKFVSGGGGLYIFHSANNAFPHWVEYNKMIGLGWRKKEFGVALTINDAGEVVRVPAVEGKGTSHGKRVDPVLTRLGNHPIHQGYPRQWRVLDLEVYSYARGPAENLTVLSYAREPKTQLNFPIEWVIRYGKGRVYNSTFGHVWKDSKNPESVRDVAFQTGLIRATEWLATGKVTTPLPKDFSTAEKATIR